VRESDVVVLFGLQGATALLAACLGRLAARPLISVNQTLPVKEERRRRWWLRLLKGTLLAQCDLHIVQNPPAEDVLTSVYRVPSSRLISAPFEAGARLFGGLLAAAPGRDFARRQFGLGGELVCAFVGNLHPFKGVPALLSAAGHLGVESSWRFLFAGPEEPRNRRGGTIERYLAQARRLGVESRVRFLGTLSPESLVQLYKAADVVALPTARDMFPKILVEAALAGLPLITTDACGAAGAVVRDGENGFVLPVGDSHAIAAALGRLADPELRRTMGARSRELVGIACSAESETAGFVAALDAVCVTHRQARARDR
jgi:glycosyltransferase involved in cell wall biosynthesis